MAPAPASSEEQRTPRKTLVIAEAAYISVHHKRRLRRLSKEPIPASGRRAAAHDDHGTHIPSLRAGANAVCVQSTVDTHTGESIIGEQRHDTVSCKAYVDEWWAPAHPVVRTAPQLRRTRDNGHCAAAAAAPVGVRGTQGSGSRRSRCTLRAKQAEAQVTSMTRYTAFNRQCAARYVRND